MHFAFYFKPWLTFSGTFYTSFMHRGLREANVQFVCIVRLKTIEIMPWERGPQISGLVTPTSNKLYVQVRFLHSTLPAEVEDQTQLCLQWSKRSTGIFSIMQATQLALEWTNPSNSYVVQGAPSSDNCIDIQVRTPELNICIVSVISDPHQASWKLKIIMLLYLLLSLHCQNLPGNNAETQCNKKILQFQSQNSNNSFFQQVNIRDFSINGVLRSFRLPEKSKSKQNTNIFVVPCITITLNILHLI